MWCVTEEVQLPDHGWQSLSQPARINKHHKSRTKTQTLQQEQEQEQEQEEEERSILPLNFTHTGRSHRRRFDW